MIAKTLLLLFVATLAPRSIGAPIITSINRLDADGSGHSEAIMPSLQPFSQLYTDSSFTFSSLPSYVLGAEYVRMVIGDSFDSDYQLQLNLSQSATVYLFIDDRTATATQPWVSAQGFQDTGDTATLIQGLPYSVYSATPPAGTFALAQNAGGLNMYSVAVVPEPSGVLLLGMGLTMGIALRRHSNNRNG